MPKFQLTSLTSSSFYSWWLSINQILDHSVGGDMRMNEKYSSPFSYALGVITTTAGALSLDQWAVLIGIICTVATFLVNWYYKRKEFKLREANSGKDTK